MGILAAARLQLGQSLRHALQSLDASSLGIVLVEDVTGVVAGTLTDGDIRRAILKGATLDAPVDDHLQRQFLSVGPDASRAEVLDLMHSRWFSQIPILDAARRVVGIHTLHEILGGAPRPNWVVVMAGGRGERLRPLTDALPKPMIPVAGRPILERIVMHLVRYGIRRIFLAVNYRADVIEQHFGDGSSFGCGIEYLREDVPLGTGGALSLLPSGAGHPLLVLNGDLLTQFDVDALLDFHVRGGFRATIGVHEYAHTIPFGVIQCDGDRVVEIREKPTQSWQTNSGIYVLDPDLVLRIPGGVPYAMPALIEDCLARTEAVGAFAVDEDWIDIGRPAELERARGKDRQ